MTDRSDTSVQLADHKDQKHNIDPCGTDIDEQPQVGEIEVEEVFKADGEIKYRTVGWVRTTVIFTKSTSLQRLDVDHS